MQWPLNKMTMLLVMVLLPLIVIGHTQLYGHTSSENVWFPYILKSIEDSHTSSMSFFDKLTTLYHYMEIFPDIFISRWERCHVKKYQSPTEFVQLENLPCSFLQFDIQEQQYKLDVDIRVNPRFYINMTFHYLHLMYDYFCDTDSIRVSNSSSWVFL